MAVIMCPDCEKEMLPYLKTGELKQIVGDKLVLYQLYFCVNCKKVYHEQASEYEFINLQSKEVEKGLTKKKKKQ